MRRLLAALLLFPVAALAVISLSLSVNSDGTISSAYPSGNKPISGSCSTWTCDARGDATIGEINEVSATELDIVGSGSNTFGNYDYAYQSVASGDIQVTAQVPAKSGWVGNLDNYTAFGVSIMEGEASGDFVYNCFVPYSGNATVQSNYGTAADSNPTWSSTNVNGLAGQSAPRYVGAAYDTSANTWVCSESSDGMTWVEVSTHVRAASYPILISVFGTSHSTSATTAATLDNIATDTTIDIYTPAGGGGAQDPVWHTNIANQTWTQNAAITSIDVSGYVSDPQSDPITFSGSGLPTGVSISTGGVISGTPTGTGSGNATITASDGTNTADDVFSWTVSATGGAADFTVNTSTNSFNCQSQGAGPGDIIELSGGNRSAFTLSNCTGASGNPIIVRNDATDSTPVVIQYTGGQADMLLCDDCDWVSFDGTGGWVGVDSGTCGAVNNSGTWTLGTTQCGFQVVRISGSPDFGLKGRGRSRNLVFEGFEIDCDGTCVNFSVADQTYTQTNNPDEWDENITFRYNYVYDAGTECLYFGANWHSGNVDSLRMRDISVHNNYVTGCGGDGINIKSTLQGNNYLYDNYVSNVGSNAAANGQDGIAILDGGIIAYGNMVHDTVKNCYKLQILNAPTTWDLGSTTINVGPLTGEFYNNVGYNCTNRGLRIASASGSHPDIIAQIYNNTIAGNDIVAASGVDGGFIRANIATGGVSGVAGVSVTNNQTGSEASQNFVNLAGDDYHLTATSPARNNAATCPATDHDGVARPQEGTCDQGAYEYAP